MATRRGQRKARNTAPETAEEGRSLPESGLGAWSWLAPSLVFACFLALYTVTLAPSVMGGDSGELTTSALTGGVPHPPGYPLYALLARLFGALPLGHSPAWRVSLLSAVSMAAANGLVCALVQLWTRRVAAGLLAAALFGTNPVVWLNATSAEVFGLNAMFVSLALLVWFFVERTADRRYVFVLSFLCGLAMCNHHTFVFVGAPLLLRALWVARRSLRSRGFAIALGLGVLGLLPYTYLLHASASKAAVSWGDQTTLDGFLAHVLRRNYGTFSLGRASKTGAFLEDGTFFPTLWRMAGHAVPRALWVAPVLVALCIRSAWKNRRDRDETRVLLAVLCFYVLAFCLLSNLSTEKNLYLTVLVRFFIQSDCMIAIVSGLGLAHLISLVQGRWPSAWVPRLAAALAATAFATGVIVHAGESSQRNNRVFADFVTRSFASLPGNAIVITMGDHLTGSVFYFREVEKLRPDVIHLDRELLGYAWYGKRKRSLYPDLYLPEGGYGKRGWNIKKLLDGNPNRPLVVIDRLDAWDQSWKEGYKLATNGLVHPIVPAAAFPSFEEWQRRDRDAISGYDVLPALRTREGSWEHTLGQLVLTTQGNRAHLSLVYSHEAGNTFAPAQYSLALLEDVVAKAGGDDRLGISGVAGLPRLFIGPTVWKDLGIAYEIVSHTNPTYAERVTIAYEKFVAQAAPDDPDLPSARQYVHTHSPRPRP